jgi:hypothetical protein
MSSKNNVNPDHYTVAGRDRPDDAARARREVPPTGGKGRRRKGAPPPPNLIPGAPPVGESTPGDQASEGDDDRR